MRVLHVIQQLQPGGAETVVLSLLRGLDGRGSVTAVAAAPGSWSPRFPKPRYDLPVLRRRPAAVPRAALQLCRATSAFRPDVVHCHNPAMAVIAAVATRRGRRPPGLVTVHGVPEGDYAASARVLRAAGLRVVGCGVGVTAALVEHGVRVTATVMNGVAPPPAPADRRRLLSEWDLPSDARLVVTVGRLQPQKRQELAIAALAELPEVTLAVLGEGPERERLAALAAQLGVADRVRLVGTRPDARAILGAADVVLTTSDWEGLPLVLLEAMMSGTPIVATAVRGVRELLRHDVDAVLCPPGDVSAIADGLATVLADPSLGARLAGRAADASARYTERVMVDSYLRLYESFL